MALSIPLVWSDAHRLHEPDAEIWVGVRTPAVEIARAGRADPRRADGGRCGGRRRRSRTTTRRSSPSTTLRCSTFLATAWEEWERAGLPVDPGQDRVVPYIFPHPGLTAGLEPAVPAATWARTGAFCFDTMTLIGPGTWQAVARRSRRGAHRGRPRRGRCSRRVRLLPPARAPRHAERLRRLLLPQQRGDRGRAPARPGAARVAIVDVDAHHGNGAQSIFWERDDVFTGSVHVDPAAGWFPHFLGGADERGTRRGSRREPQPAAAARDRRPRVDARPWPSCVQAARSHGVEALVLALGVDAAGGRPGEPARRHRRRATARPAASSAPRGFPWWSCRRAGTISRRSAGSCSPRSRASRRARRKACVPEPLAHLDREGRGRGSSLAAAQGPEAAAALAARGDRRNGAAALAHARRRRTHLRLHPGPRHVRRLAARPRRAAAPAADDRPRPDAVLGGHRAAPLARRLAGGVRRPGPRLARRHRGRAAAEARRRREPRLARRRPARRLGRARGHFAARRGRHGRRLAATPLWL